MLCKIHILRNFKFPCFKKFALKALSGAHGSWQTCLVFAQVDKERFHEIKNKGFKIALSSLLYFFYQSLQYIFSCHLINGFALR